MSMITASRVLRARSLRGPIAAAVALLVVTACGGGQPPVAASPATATPAAAASKQYFAGDTLFPDLKGQEITVMGNGGAVQDQQFRALQKEFAEKTGLKINQVNPVNFTKIQAEVESGNVSTDLVNTQNSVTVPNCGVLWEKTPEINRSLLLPQAVTDECAVSIGIVSYIFTYNKNVFGSNPPTSWVDFFDVKKYPGKRAVWSSINTAPYEIALLADGVAPSQLYPIDFDRALRKWATIRDQLVPFPNLGTASEQMVAQAAPLMAVNGNRTIIALQQNAPYGAVWAQPIGTFASYSIVKGSKNKFAAQALLQYMATAKPQQEYAILNGVGPVAKGAELPTDPIFRANSPSLPENLKNTVFQDARWWTKERFDIGTSRWAAFLAGG